MYFWDIENINIILDRPLIIKDESLLKKYNKNFIITEIPNEVKLNNYIPTFENDLLISIFDQQFTLYENSVSADSVSVDEMMMDMSVGYSDELSNILSEVEHSLQSISNKRLTREEGIEVFSRLYLKLTEGVFTKIMAINCFLIDVCNQKRIGNLKDYVTLGLARMEKIICNSYGSRPDLLSGYNRLIRNSIAHSHTNLRQFGQKIKFIDSYKGNINTLVVSDNEFRHLVYQIYNNIHTQIFAAKCFWKNYTETNNDLPKLEVDDLIACIRDLYFDHIDEVIYKFRLETGYEKPEFDVFNFAYKDNAIEISIRIGNMDIKVLLTLLNGIAQLIAKICKYLEISSTVKTDKVKILVSDLNDIMIVIIDYNTDKVKSPVHPKASEDEKEQIIIDDFNFKKEVFFSKENRDLPNFNIVKIAFDGSKINLLIRVETTEEKVIYELFRKITSLVIEITDLYGEEIYLSISDTTDKILICSHRALFNKRRNNDN
jgi:hypothetical protein